MSNPETKPPLVPGLRVTVSKLAAHALRAHQEAMRLELDHAAALRSEAERLEGQARRRGQAITVDALAEAGHSLPRGVAVRLLDVDGVAWLEGVDLQAEAEARHSHAMMEHARQALGGAPLPTCDPIPDPT